MAEIELTEIFKNRWVKRLIYLLILASIIWKFFPAISTWIGQSNLDRSARVITETIKKARTYTINHEDSYAADFNLYDNTFALVYPKRGRPEERKIVDEMKLLPEGIEIIKCTFQTILIEGKEDPDFNQIIFRISFDKMGNAFSDDSAIWIADKRGQVKEISITNPGGKLEIYKQERQVDYERLDVERY